MLSNCIYLRHFFAPQYCGSPESTNMLKSIGDFNILRNIHTQFANSIGMNKYSDNYFASYFESFIKSHVN